MTLPDLIRRLEAAEAGSKELDWMVAWFAVPESFSSPREYFNRCRAVNKNYPADGTEQFRKQCFSWAEDENYDIPSYTRSIDAALTLVPENCGWSCGGPDSTLIKKPRPWAQTFRGQYIDFNGAGATPAIALTIACLKARLNALPK